MPKTGEKNRFLRLLPLNGSTGDKSIFFTKALASAYREAHKTLGRTEEARKRASFIAEASRMIGANLDYPTTLENAAKYATPFLADCCIIDTLEDQSQALRASVAFHDLSEKDAEFASHPGPLSEEIRYFIEKVVQARETVTFKADESREFFAAFPGIDAKTAVLLPLTVGETEVGLMTLFGKSDREYSDGYYLTAMEYADRVSLAINHARLHDQLQKALQARDEFISIASHELQNPLSVLRLQLGMLEIFWNPENPNSLSRSRLLKTKEAIERALDKLSGAIEDVFDVTQMRNNQFKITRSQVNLTQLMEDTVARITPLLRSAGCEPRLNLEAQVTGNWDRKRLEQVVVNLLNNAAKYAPNGPIDVSLRLEGETARISVKDHGGGISKEKLQYIFEPFKRLDPRNQIKGLGLGLYICQKIIDAHGGKIWVECEPHQGASFLVDLPLDVLSEDEAGPGL